MVDIPARKHAGMTVQNKGKGTYRQHFADVVDLNFYASSATLPGRQGHMRALALALRGQQDYSRAKTPSRKGFRIKIGFLGVLASWREKMSWVYRQLFVDLWSAAARRRFLRRDVSR